MKVPLIAAAATAALATLTGAAQAGDLRISLDGVQARGGVLYVAAQSREQFMQPAMTGGDRRAAPHAGAASFTLKNLPEGDYAVSVLHDEDGDHQMKREPDGRPLEGWAMVNYRGGGAPVFDQVKVHVPAQGEASVRASMVYPR